MRRVVYVDADTPSMTRIDDTLQSVGYVATRRQRTITLFCFGTSNGTLFLHQHRPRCRAAAPGLGPSGDRAPMPPVALRRDAGLERGALRLRLRPLDRQRTRLMSSSPSG